MNLPICKQLMQRLPYLGIVAAVASGATSPCRALDGNDIPKNHSAQRAIVTVTAFGGACTGAALPGGVVLTAAHCVLEKAPDGLDHSSWSREPLAVTVGYFIDGKNLSRRSGAVATFVEEARDIALIKVEGGHPSEVQPFRPPVGPAAIADLPLFTKPLVLITGRGGYANGPSKIDNSIVRYSFGEASYSPFAPAGFIVSITEGNGACGGDSGSPIFLSDPKSLPSDVQDFMLVGVVGSIWRGQAYGDRARRCSHEVTSTSVVIRPRAGTDSSSWIAQVLDKWANDPTPPIK